MVWHEAVSWTSEGDGGKVSERERDSQGVESEGDIKSTNKAREGAWWLGG